MFRLVGLNWGYNGDGTIIQEELDKHSTVPYLKGRMNNIEFIFFKTASSFNNEFLLDEFKSFEEREN